MAATPSDKSLAARATLAKTGKAYLQNEARRNHDRRAEKRAKTLALGIYEGRKVSSGILAATQKHARSKT